MRAVVVYESMYGNTHRVAEAIGEGLRKAGTVDVVSVGQAGFDLLADADLLVVGGPTHVHGMSRPSTRRAAIEETRKPGSQLQPDGSAGGPGIRDWLSQLVQGGGNAAAFDTRLGGRPTLTGQASKGIARELRHRGRTMVTSPESFIVTKGNELHPGEIARARAFGVSLAALIKARQQPGKTAIA
jgi:hypothetical protein